MYDFDLEGYKEYFILAHLDRTIDLYRKAINDGLSEEEAIDASRKEINLAISNIDAYKDSDILNSQGLSMSVNPFRDDQDLLLSSKSSNNAKVLGLKNYNI